MKRWAAHIAVDKQDPVRLLFQGQREVCRNGGFTFMLPYARDQDHFGVVFMRLRGNMRCDLFEALDILKFSVQIRYEMLILLPQEEIAEGRIGRIVIQHAKRFGVQLLTKIFFALDRLLAIGEIHEGQRKQKRRDQESPKGLIASREGRVRPQRYGRLLQHLHDHIARNIRRQARNRFHDRADDPIGIARRIGSDSQRHQVGSVNDPRRSRGVEGAQSEILADLLLQQVAVENIGEAVRHGGGCRQIAVGVVAGGFGGHDKGGRRGIGAAEIRTDRHAHDHSDRDRTEDDHPEIAHGVAQHAVQIQLLENGGNIRVVFVHVQSSTIKIRLVVPSSVSAPVNRACCTSWKLTI